MYTEMPFAPSGPEGLFLHAARRTPWWGDELQASPVTHAQIAALHTAQPLLRAVSLRLEIMSH